MSRPEPPRFTIRFVGDRSCYQPGEMLSCEYRVDLPTAAGEEGESARRVQAIETSVLWETTGKGDEDLGVHFFERRERQMAQPEVIRQWHRLNTVLPLAPLSYDGKILKIRWLVRVRLFLADGTSCTQDEVFRVAPPKGGAECAESGGAPVPKKRDAGLDEATQ